MSVKEETTTKNYWLPFVILAFCIAVFVFDITWWHALIVLVIGRFNFAVTTTNTYRRRY